MTIRRVRLAAGMLTLSALVLSFAEAFAASTCAPMLGMGIAAMAEAGEPSASDCMPDPLASLPGPDDEGLPHCPFGPMTVAQGCAAAASLPARAVFVEESPLAALPTIAFDGAERELLLATILFHPPKA